MDDEPHNQDEGKNKHNSKHQTDDDVVLGLPRVKSRWRLFSLCTPKKAANNRLHYLMHIGRFLTRNGISHINFFLQVRTIVIVISDARHNCC